MEKERGSLNVWTESAHLEKTLMEERQNNKEQLEDNMDEEVNPFEFHGETTDTMDWVACKDFTVDLGMQQIGDLIKTWRLAPCWLYSLHFLHHNKREHHDFYHYKARFSAPSSERPVQGTVSVFFVVAIYEFKPQTRPVEVKFRIESSRLVHDADCTCFTEKWLLDVLESKALQGEQVDL